MYNKTQEARNKDSKYQFNICEAANWKLISDKIQEKGDRIAEASDEYKKKHRLIQAEKKQFYAGCVKEYKNKELGKGIV